MTSSAVSGIFCFESQSFNMHKSSLRFSCSPEYCHSDLKLISLLNSCWPLLWPAFILSLCHTQLHADRHALEGARWEEVARTDKLMCQHIISHPQCIVAHLFSSRQQKRPCSQSRECVAPHVSSLMRLFIVTQLSYLHPPTLHLSPYQTHQICCLSASPSVIRQKSREPQTK